MRSVMAGHRRPRASSLVNPATREAAPGSRKMAKRYCSKSKTLLQQELSEVILVNEGGRHRRMSKRQAYFKTLVNRALKDPRYAALLMKTMEQYDLVKDEQVPTCMRVEFVRARREDDDQGSGNA